MGRSWSLPVRVLQKVLKNLKCNVYSQLDWTASYLKKCRVPQTKIFYIALYGLLSLQVLSIIVMVLNEEKYIKNAPEQSYS